METLDCGMPPNGKTASFSCTCSSKYTLESCIPKLILLTKLQQPAEYHCSGGKKTTTIKNKTQNNKIPLQKQTKSGRIFTHTEKEHVKKCLLILALHTEE